MRRLLALIFAISLLAPSAALAGNRIGPSSGVASVGHSPAQTREQVQKFWTSERMAEALRNPLAISREGAPQQLGISRSQVDGTYEPRSLPPYCPDCGEAKQPSTGDGGATLAQAGCPSSSYEWRYDLENQEYPQRVIGRLFFQTAQGDLSTCSASLIQEDLLLTAGHCVAENGRWHTNFLFVPGYLQEERPHGQAGAVRMFTFASWLNKADFSHDVGFVVLDDKMGERLGWLGFATEADPALITWHQFGYPAQEPFDGSLLTLNISALGTRDCTSGTPCAMAVGSPFTKGSSGGPWLYINEEGHYANGLNSYTYFDCKYNMYSPYFGEDVWNLLQDVINRGN